ncbi:putative cytochrome c oxidase assembly protein PET191 [Helianthus anomalus]
MGQNRFGLKQVFVCIGLVENRSFRECAKEKSPLISSECVGLRETYFNCKRGQVVFSRITCSTN